MNILKFVLEDIHFILHSAPTSMVRYILFITLMTATSSCDFFRIVTATNHKYKVQNSESINRYLKQGKLDKYPVFCLDTSYFYSKLWWPDDVLFNKDGDFLSINSNLNNSDSACPSESFKILAMANILQNGDEAYLSDSLKLKFTMLDSPDGIPYVQTRTYEMKLTDLSGFLRTLDGKRVNIFQTYNDYVLFKQFNLSGKSKLLRIAIREQIKEIEEVNRMNDKKIQIILLSLDRLDWMELRT